MQPNLFTIIIFWLGVLSIVYVYFGYPLLVWLVRNFRPRPWIRKSMLPTVSIVIAARNEEKHIRGKIENTFAIDYPSEKLEIIVVSDFSTDNTDLIVKSFSDRGVKLVRPDRRVGKTEAQNLGVEEAEGEIILFSDATTKYPPNVIEQIVPNFADNTIGCVGGKLTYQDPNRTTVGRGASDYWNYETNLKVNESLAGSLIGVSGCLYAVRRTAYKQMYPEACSDFLIATIMQRQGLRTVFEPRAVCHEETNVRVDQELRMRTRIAAQTLSDLWLNFDMMNPFKSGFYAVSLISHKLLRYVTPYIFLVVYLANIVLAFNSAFYAVTLLLQTAFWLIGFVGLIVYWRSSKRSIFSYPAYFALITVASIAGFLKFIVGEKFEKWEPTREQTSD